MTTQTTGDRAHATGTTGRDIAALATDLEAAGWKPETHGAFRVWTTSQEYMPGARRSRDVVVFTDHVGKQHVEIGSRALSGPYGVTTIDPFDPIWQQAIDIIRRHTKEQPR